MRGHCEKCNNGADGDLLNEMKLVVRSVSHSDQSLYLSSLRMRGSLLFFKQLNYMILFPYEKNILTP